MVQQNICSVYVASIPDAAEFAPVFPPARQKEIEATVNEELKLRRYFVWKLLEYAVQHAFSLDWESLHFHKSEFGKWSCDELYFSLSHTEGMVAVAVSDAPVGIDLENIRVFREKFSRRVEDFLQKITAAGEKNTPPQLDAALRLWTAKESIFKCRGERQFIPNKFDTTQFVTESRILPLPEPTYLSLCGEYAAPARYFLLENEALTEC